MRSVAVVGGGIVGVAVARELTRRLPDARVTLLEKEDRLAAHQTGHNSGVVHAGLYYEPGSLKARLCRQGVRLLRDLAERHGLAYEECGKVVVARDARESARLDALHARAVANGVPDVRLLDADGLREVEPHAVGVRALHSPRTAIVDYPAVTRALAAEVETAGGTVRLGHEVTRIEPRPGAVRVSTGAGLEEELDLVVTCAGLQSDRVAQLAGEAGEPRIVPFLGDYVLLAPEQRSLVRGLVYPVPDPRYPFLGVHLTRHVDGEVSIGPNAFLSWGRESYDGRPRARDLREVVGYAGFWRFAAANLPAAVRETRTVLSRSAFVAAARSYVPEVDPARVRPGPRGIRAQALDRRGRLVDDFVITGTDRLVHVRNAPSPGATSALAIAAHVVDEALGRAGLTPTDERNRP
ncbi:MAG TPA: L-2-hydroxyglutarate oxidase [Nocardioides sp.]|nr:L-2-hydroxyglutarate oxidase [Nocardioides sp.]